MIPAAPPVVPAAPAPAPVVAAALTQTEVRVTSGFRGAEIVVYGAVFDPRARPHDVVVAVRGPEQPVRLARKVQVGGLWLNSRPVVFRGAPGFYAAASTRPLGEIAGFRELRRLGLGVQHLRIAAPLEQRVETTYGVRDVVVSALGEDYLLWRRAVVRLKTEAQLYAADAAGVRFVDQGLFRATIRLPAEAPTGTYQAEIVLFQDGRPVSQRSRTLTVEKVGFERAVAGFATDAPWLYGVACVLLALGAGYAASVAFRRT